jgi:hypothetical protein
VRKINTKEKKRGDVLCPRRRPARRLPSLSVVALLVVALRHLRPRRCGRPRHCGRPRRPRCCCCRGVVVDRGQQTRQLDAFGRISNSDNF